MSWVQCEEFGCGEIAGKPLLRRRSLWLSGRDHGERSVEMIHGLTTFDDVGISDRRPKFDGGAGRGVIWPGR